MKHPAIYVVLSLLLAGDVLLAGQNTQPASNPTKASIEGTVIRAGAGPLWGARISLSKQETNGNTQAERVIAPVTTDSSGQFHILGVDPGQYRIAAERDGFIRQEYGQRNPSSKGMTLTVDPGQRMTVEFQMAPASVIAGRVLDEQGEPVAGATVQVQTYQYINGKRTLIQMPQFTPAGEGVAPAVRGTTNDRGEYRLFWLQPGEYYISVTARPQPSPYSTIDLSSQPLQRIITPAGLVGTVSEIFSPVYFPGVADPEAATPVSVTALVAEIGGIDFTWRPIRLASVRGRIVAPPVPLSPQDATAGRRIAAQPVNVVLTRLDGTRAQVAGSSGGGPDPSGNQVFELRGVPPAAYYLNAVSRRDGAAYFTRTRIDVGNSDVDGVSLEVRPTVDLPGKIVLDSAPPQSLNLTQLMVNFAPLDPSLGLLYSGGNRAGQDGAFTLKSIAPVEYRISVSGLPAGAYVASATSGSADVLTGPFPVQPESLEVRIGFSVGHVTGSVLSPDGSPAGGSLVTLIPAEPRRARMDLYFTATADLNGAFTFNNVPAGDYQIFAWEQIPSGAYQSAEFIHRFEGRGQVLHIENGSSANTQLNLIPAVTN